MKFVKYQDSGMAAVFLRITLGVMWVAHAYLKWEVFTIAGFAAWLEGQGLPAFMAWPIFLLELIGGFAILIGFYGRYFSAILLPVILVATWTHFPNGWLHTSTGGGWEYPLFIAFASVSHFLLGDGKYTINSKLLNQKMA